MHRWGKNMASVQRQCSHEFKSKIIMFVHILRLSSKLESNVKLATYLTGSGKKSEITTLSCFSRLPVFPLYFWEDLLCWTYPI